MKRTKLDSKQLEVISNNNGLREYLTSLNQDVPFTKRSELYDLDSTEKLEPDEIRDRWLEHLKSIATGDKFEKEVFQFDTSQLEKWGPQGGHESMDKLFDEIIAPSFSESEIPSAFKTKEWQHAKKLATTILWELGCRDLRPASYKNVVDDMRARDTLESNSGWPLFTRRNKPEVIKQSIEEAENGLWKTYPAIALFRRYHGKTRVVWMYPMSANLVEGSFFQVLQSRIIEGQRKADVKHSFFAPWVGFEKVREMMSMAYNSKMNWSVAASDFSATDAHFKLAASMEVLDVIRPCFQRQYHELLEESIRYMHTIPLLIGVDEQVIGEHGVSSGSNWTNFDETIFDLILSIYVQIMESGAYLEVYSGFYAIGDDMSWVVWRHHYDPKFSSRLQQYGESVGQEIKADKTTNYPDKVKSLQRLFQRGYCRPDGQVKGVYSTIRALNSLVYPERFHSSKREGWSKELAGYRALMILENCVDHPCFEEFCRFVVAGDPIVREVALMTKREQDALSVRSKHVRALNPTYNQEKRDKSLADFESVKFIRSL